MYSEDHYVVLESGQAEQFLTAHEMFEKLKDFVQSYSDALPSDVVRLNTIDAKAKALLDESCELEIAPGRSIQWYAVRLEK